MPSWGSDRVQFKAVMALVTACGLLRRFFESLANFFKGIAVPSAGTSTSRGPREAGPMRDELGRASFVAMTFIGRVFLVRGTVARPQSRIASTSNGSHDPTLRFGVGCRASVIAQSVGQDRIPTRQAIQFGRPSELESLFASRRNASCTKSLAPFGRRVRVERTGWQEQTHYFGTLASTSKGPRSTCLASERAKHAMTVLAVPPTRRPSGKPSRCRTQKPRH